MKDRLKSEIATIQDDKLSVFEDFGIILDEKVWVISTQTTNPDADKPIIIDWNKLEVNCFNDLRSGSAYGNLQKEIAATWLTGGAGEFKALKAITVKQRSICLKKFLGCLLLEKIYDLRTTTPRQVQDVFEKYYFQRNTPLGRKSILSTINVIRDLHRFSSFLCQGLPFDPFPRKVINAYLKRSKSTGYWEAPPEPVCLFLIGQALNFIKDFSGILISAYYGYIKSVEEEKARGTISRFRLREVGNSYLVKRKIKLTGNLTRREICVVKGIELALLLRRLQEACFIVISYTVGPRVSEIRRAGPGCISLVSNKNGKYIPYYSAWRSKMRFALSDEEDRKKEIDARPWVLSSGALHAFTILDKISLPAREKTGLKSYWLTFAGNGLWPFKHSNQRFTVISAAQFNNRLRNFSDFIDLEKETGWSGHLHSHMGRKCFASVMFLK